MLADDGTWYCYSVVWFQLFKLQAKNMLGDILNKVESHMIWLLPSWLVVWRLKTHWREGRKPMFKFCPSMTIENLRLVVLRWRPRALIFLNQLVKFHQLKLWLKRDLGGDAVFQSKKKSASIRSERQERVNRAGESVGRCDQRARLAQRQICTDIKYSAGMYR